MRIETPGDLTAQWLTDALGGEQVTAFSTERIGTGQMSECYRVALSYDGGTGPASVVLKVAAADPTNAEAIEAERDGRKVLLMVSVGLNTTMSNEARAFAAHSPESSRHIAADAIIVRDFGHQLAANVFVRHHKPGRPIQMFPDRDSALAWLRTQRHLVV